MAFLPQTIESILTSINQSTHKSDINIIIKDGGSDTPQEYIDYVNTLSNCGVPITLLRRDYSDPERNVIETTNAATGEYVWIFSDDDIMLPEAIETVFNNLPIYDYIITNRSIVSKDLSTELCNNYFQKMKNDSRYYKNVDSNIVEYQCAKDIMKDVGLHDNFCFISTSIVKKSLFSAVDYKEYSQHNSRWSHTAILVEALHNNRCALLKNVLVKQRQYNQSPDIGIHIGFNTLNLFKELNKRGLIDYKEIEYILEDGRNLMDIIIYWLHQQWDAASPEDKALAKEMLEAQESGKYAGAV
jgi:hypothetical protein